MARLIIAQNAHVQTVSYALPNKHYIPVDMGYLGVENLVSCVLRCCLFLALTGMLFPISQSASGGLHAHRGSQVRIPSHYAGND
jgi:hypothetical protein